MPKVSIIVPIYNVERWLDRCVQSLINQTLTDIEIILVDDKSPDNCPRLCDEYAVKDKRIKVIHKAENEGLGYARNSGLDVATGKYVAFIDSDDYIELNAYERLYQECESNDLEICYFRHRRVDENGKYYDIPHGTRIYDFKNSEEVDNLLLAMLGDGPSCSDMRMRVSVSTCMALYNRCVIERNSIRFVSEREVASEDLIFHINFLPKVKRVRVLPDVYYNYFVNSASISNSYDEKKFTRIIRSLEYIDNVLPKMFTKDRYIEHYSSCVLSRMKIILKFEAWQPMSIISRSKKIRDICDMSLCSNLYQSNYTKCRPLTDRIIIFCMKNRISLFFIFLYKVMYRKYGISK